VLSARVTREPCSILTCRRSSRARSSCPRSGRPLRRSAADQAAYARQVAWTHLAACSRSGSTVPYPRCPPSCHWDRESRVTYRLIVYTHDSLPFSVHARTRTHSLSFCLCFPRFHCYAWSRGSPSRAAALPPPDEGGWRTREWLSVAESKRALSKMADFRKDRPLAHARCLTAMVLLRLTSPHFLCGSD